MDDDHHRTRRRRSGDPLVVAMGRAARSCDGRSMTVTEVPPPPPLPVAVRWRWRRLRLAAFVVHTMLVVQCVMALAHSLRVPGRIVALSHIHEPIRAWRVQLIDAALEEVGELHDVWWIVTVVTALAF